MKQTMFLLNSLTVGGSETKTIRIANALHERGIPVYIAYLNGPHTLRSVINENIPVRCLRREGWLDFSTVLALRKHIIQMRVTNVLCVNLYPMLYTKLAFLLSLLAPACWVSINSTHHTSLKEAMQWIFYMPFLWRAQKIIFGCKYQQDLWIARYHLNAPKCMHILNGVDSEHFSPNSISEDELQLFKERLKISPETIVIGTVGTMRPEKRHADLLKAAGCLKLQGLSFKLIFAGDGSERGRIELLCRELDLEPHCIFLGQMIDVRPALAAMDIFVLSSATETFSNAALEAMSMGKPVILSQTGGAPEMVINGNNGNLFPPGDVDALVFSIRQLIGNREERKRMGLRARKMVEERFTLPRMVDQYHKLMLEC